MPGQPPNTVLLREARKARSALLHAAGLPPEHLPVPASIGMVSDAMEALRKRGTSDGPIAWLIRDRSTISLRIEDIATSYAARGQREAHGH